MRLSKWLNDERPGAGAAKDLSRGTMVQSTPFQTDLLLDSLRSRAPGIWATNKISLAQSMRGLPYLAINTLATQFAAAKPVLYQEVDDELDEDGRIRLSRSDPMYRVLKKPNPLETWGDVAYQMSQQLDTTGMCLIWLPTESSTTGQDDGFEPQEMYVIPTGTAFPLPRSPQYPEGAYRVIPYYNTSFFMVAPNYNAGSGAVIPAEQVVVVKNHHPLIRWEGYAVLTAISQSVDTINAVDQSRFATMMQGCEQTVAAKAYGQKAQSWLNETLGGAIVAPPEQGELIDLFRNKDALVNAGARTVPLPPQGRVQFPRQTQASTGYWVGENVEITESQVKTGTLTLSAKKVGCLIKTPNELIRYGGPAAEALFRLDMTKTLTLTMDKQLLDGAGSDTRPMGLLNTPGIATVTPTTVGNNGNTLAPQDVYDWISTVMANNAEFEGWIMRPEMFFALAKKRVGGSTANDGPFAFSMFRQLGDKIEAALAGYRATLTPQVSNTRSKGSASNLTYIAGGMWSDFLLGFFGAIEFAATAQGDTSFANDQTWIRAILSCDGGARHPGAFAVADQLVVA